MMLSVVFWKLFNDALEWCLSLCAIWPHIMQGPKYLLCFDTVAVMTISSSFEVGLMFLIRDADCTHLPHAWEILPTVVTGGAFEGEIAVLEWVSFTIFFKLSQNDRKLMTGLPLKANMFFGMTQSSCCDLHTDPEHLYETLNIYI